MLLCPEHAVWRERNGIDAFFHQEFDKVGVVAGCLAADPDGGVVLVGGFNKLGDHGLDGGIAFIEEVSQEVGVTVAAEDELGEII